MASRQWYQLISIHILIIAILMAPSSRSFAIETHALLINGGGSSKSNRFYFYRDLQSVKQATSFLGVKNLPSLYGSGSYIETETFGDEKLKQELVLGQQREGQLVIQASKENLKIQINELVKNSRPNDNIIIYITGHGGRRDSESSIVLWGEQISVGEFRKLLSSIPSNRNIQIITNICYGGGLSALDQSNMCVVANQIPLLESAAKDLTTQPYPISLSRKIMSQPGQGLYNLHLEAVGGDLSKNIGYSSLDYFLENHFRDRSPLSLREYLSKLPSSLRNLPNDRIQFASGRLEKEWASLRQGETAVTKMLELERSLGSHAMLWLSMTSEERSKAWNDSMNQHPGALGIETIQQLERYEKAWYAVKRITHEIEFLETAEQKSLNRYANIRNCLDRALR